MGDVPRRHASLSERASTVAVAGCRSGVTEGSPGRLLCYAGLFAMVCLPRARTGPLWLCGGALTVDGEGRLCRGCQTTGCKTMSKMYVTGLEGTRVVSIIIDNNGTADCVARGCGCRCLGSFSSARMKPGNQQIPAHVSLAATQQSGSPTASGRIDRD